MSSMEQRHNDEKIMYILGQLDAKMDGVHLRLDKVNGRLDKHGNVINELETSRDVAVGKTSVFAMIGGLVVSIFFWALNHWFK